MDLIRTQRIIFSYTSVETQHFISNAYQILRLSEF